MASNPRTSAALLVYRYQPPQNSPGPELQVLIAHMGGPFWARKDNGAWSIPKGEFEPPETALAAARREFEEEMGSAAPSGPYLELGTNRQPSGKVITTFAVEGDFDLSTFASNLFEMEWPRGSGRVQQFPEMDRAAWFPLDQAAVKLTRGQVPILQDLTEALAQAQTER